MKYRKKPVVIETVRVTNADYNGYEWDGCPFSEMPDWLKQAIEAKVITVAPADTDYAQWNVHTLEGTMLAGPDDYIIRGVKGELYPCKPDIFAATYEPAE